MEDTRYFGSFVPFEAASKNASGTLMSADCIIGAPLVISFKTIDGNAKAFLSSSYDAEVGFLDDAESRHLAILKARGWTLRALLSFVSFVDTESAKGYRGEIALICNDPAFDEECNAFAKGIGKKIGEDVRPQVALSSDDIDEMLSHNGRWVPEARREPLGKQEGRVILKRRMTFSDKMVEAGRAKNKGCYVTCILIFVGAAALILFILKACGAF